MLYFVKNNHKIILKCRQRSGGVVSSTVGPWQIAGLGSGGKVPEKFWPFYVWMANNQLEIEEPQEAKFFQMQVRSQFLFIWFKVKYYEN